MTRCVLHTRCPLMCNSTFYYAFSIGRSVGHSLCRQSFVYTLVLYIGAVHCCRTLVLYIGAVHWCCTLVLYIGAVHWCCTFVLYIVAVHWCCTLLLYIDAVHWCCTLVLYISAVHNSYIFIMVKSVNVTFNAVVFTFSTGLPRHSLVARDVRARGALLYAKFQSEVHICSTRLLQDVRQVSPI